MRPGTQASSTSSSSSFSSLQNNLAGLIVSGDIRRPSSLRLVVGLIVHFAEHPSSLLLSEPLARHYFPIFPNSTTFFYNSLLRAFSRSRRHPHLAFYFYSLLLRDSLTPDRFTFPSLAVSHSTRRIPVEGHQTHAHVLKRGFGSDSYVFNTLLSMYSAFGECFSSRKLFDTRSPGDLDSVSWNTMIDGYVKSGELESALKLFEEMPIRNEVSWRMLVVGHATKGELDVARTMFNKMPVSGRNVITWNSMISGFARQGLLHAARKLFDEMPDRNLVSWNSMISGYAMHGEMEKANHLFEIMPEEKDLISWSCMISGYTQNNQHIKALLFFKRMQIYSKEKPNAVTIVSLLSACAHLASLNQGKWVHSYIDKHKMVLDDDYNLGASLIDMYSKCGDLLSALKVFQKLNSKNVSSWNALITGLAINGAVFESLDAFEQMMKSGRRPNDVTFLGVLSACSHGGLVDDGRKYFQSMAGIHGVEPEMKHFGCMVDLFGRAGLLEEAEKLIRTMPVKPDEIILGALLSSCKIYKNTEIADRIRSDFFLELKPQQGGCYVLLSSIYSSAGRLLDASKMRNLFHRSGAMRESGSSSVETQGVVYEFGSGDRSHPETNAIYSWLDDTYVRLKTDQGYSPLFDDVLMDLDGEDKENWLAYHSEKLALAFALTRPDPQLIIRIVKNLRICGDCHSYMKCVSKLISSEIYVRDRVRFHHFKNGSCSCCDYW